MSTTLLTEDKYICSEDKSVDISQYFDLFNAFNVFHAESFSFLSQYWKNIKYMNDL